MTNFLGRATVILNFARRFRSFYLVEKYNVGLKTLLQPDISETEFYGDLVYRFIKIMGKYNISEKFRKLMKRYKRKWLLPGYCAADCMPSYQPNHC